MNGRRCLCTISTLPSPSFYALSVIIMISIYHPHTPDTIARSWTTRCTSALIKWHPQKQQQRQQQQQLCGKCTDPIPFTQQTPFTNAALTLRLPPSCCQPLRLLQWMRAIQLRPCPIPQFLNVLPPAPPPPAAATALLQQPPLRLLSVSVCGCVRAMAVTLLGGAPYAKPCLRSSMGPHGMVGKALVVMCVWQIGRTPCRCWHARAAATCLLSWWL